MEGNGKGLGAHLEPRYLFTNKTKVYQNPGGHGSLDTPRLRRGTREPIGGISDT